MSNLSPQQLIATFRECSPRLPAAECHTTLVNDTALRVAVGAALPAQLSDQHSTLLAFMLEHTRVP